MTVFQRYRLVPLARIPVRLVLTKKFHPYPLSQNAFAYGHGGSKGRRVLAEWVPQGGLSRILVHNKVQHSSGPIQAMKRSIRLCPAIPHVREEIFTPRTDETDYDLDHLVPHLPFREVVRDLHGANPTQETCARS